VPSILRYIIIESESRGVPVLWREHGEREWRRGSLDTEGPIGLPEFDIALAFDEVYRGNAFDWRG
jgi:hypothetical protein